MSFGKSIGAAVGRRKQEVNKAIIGMATELFTAVVNFSPVQPAAKYAKGQFINNWRIGINGTDNTTITAKSMLGANSRAGIVMMSKSLAFLNRDGYVTFSNNTHYAALVEYKGWPQSINPRWINNVGPYAPVRNAFITVVPKLKVRP